MSRRGKDRQRASRSRAARRRRRLVRVLGVLVGGLVTATGGWLYGGARPAAPERPASTTMGTMGTMGRNPGAPPVMSSVAPVGPVGPADVAEPVVRGGRLEVPIVDWTEVLPSCH